MKMNKLKKKFGAKTVETLLIVIGTLLIAVGFNTMLLPNKIVSGGINGLTIILYEKFQLPPSAVLFATNIVLLILCYILLGKKSFMKSLLGSLLVPFFVSLLSHLGTATKEPMLAAIFGGLIVGFGIGLVFLGDGSTGGTTLIALIIHKYTGLKVGILLGICDSLVLLSALFVFNLQTVLYALIALFLTSKMVDFVQVGPIQSKQLLVITEKEESIRQLFLKQFQQGVTFVPIEGGYELAQHKMLMAVIPDTQFLSIKQNILSIDPQAFIITTDINEVLGKNYCEASR